MVNVNKESLKSLIAKLQEEAKNINVSRDKLKRFNDIQGSGAVYEALHQGTVEAGDLASNIATMVTLISQNLQAIHDDVEGMDRKLNEEIAKGK